MNDNYIIDDYEYQDTIPDAFDQEETDIYEDDTIDTPDSEDQYSEKCRARCGEFGCAAIRVRKAGNK